MFYRPSPRYAVEAIHKFGTNIIGFQLGTGERRLYIIGCYLALDDTLTIDSVLAAPKERPQGAKLLITGDLNINMENSEGDMR